MESIVVSHSEKRPVVLLREKHMVKDGQISKFVADLLESYGLHSSSRALELSCGDGSDVKGMRSRGFYIDGTDSDDILLELSHKKNPESKFYKLDADGNWNSVGKRYDAVYSMLSFSGFENPYKVCENAALVIRPGGLFVFDYMNADRNWSSDYSLNEAVGSNGVKVSVKVDGSSVVVGYAYVINEVAYNVSFKNRLDSVWSVAAYLRPYFDIVGAYTLFSMNSAKWRADERITIVARRIGG